MPALLTSGGALRSGCQATPSIETATPMRSLRGARYSTPKNGPVPSVASIPAAPSLPRGSSMRVQVKPATGATVGWSRSTMRAVTSPPPTTSATAASADVVRWRR